MHNLKDPSFFLTNNISAPFGDELGRIKPFYINSSNWTFNSFSLLGAIWYEALEIGCILGISSIVGSAPLRGGNPGSSCNIPHRGIGKTGITYPNEPTRTSQEGHPSLGFSS